MTRIIGLIAGNGQLPYDIIDHCLANNLPVFPIFIDDQHIKDQEYIRQKIYPLNCVFHKIGQVSQAIDYFKANNVNEIVFIGGIKRPNLLKLDVDYLGAKLVTRILKNKFLGDDTTLRIIAKFFNEYGFEVTAPQSLLTKRITHAAGIIVSSNNYHNFVDLDDNINFGLQIARLIGELDVGQAVIVENKYILAVEAAEGTDQLIQRSQSLQKLNQQAILVKAQKPNQDTKFDMPTIGPQTIKYAAIHGLAGIVIEADKVFIVEPEKVIDQAQASNIFLIAST